MKFTVLVNIEADNTYRGIEIASEYQDFITLLLTDIIMPGMNGKEMFEHISQIRPGLKVIFMSGYTSNVNGVYGVLSQG